MAPNVSVLERPVAVVRDRTAPLPSPAPRPGARARAFVRAHQHSLVLLGLLLAVVAIVNLWNLHGWPGRINDDEGTYVAQAWAMLARGDISHYTYWYDHPFLGWALIAGYAWLTGGIDRVDSAVMIGREFMVITTLVTCVLLFLLSRRLGFGRLATTVAVLVFGLSPLAVHYHRMIFLDNIAAMWVVAALAIAASPRRSLAAALWCAVCMAGAVWTKETIVILLPAVVWLLVRHTVPRTLPWSLGVFFATFSMLVAAYPMYAALNKELLPGEGHVSLGWAVWWQVFGRSGSGSLLDPDSATFALTMSWVNLDPWLLLGGVALIPFGLAVARLRPVALALLIQVVMMMRGGYMPYAYVVALLPFAAILIGGLVDVRRSDLRRPERTIATWRRIRLVAASTARRVPAWPKLGERVGLLRLRSHVVWAGLVDRLRDAVADDRLAPTRRLLSQGDEWLRGVPAAVRRWPIPGRPRPVDLVRGTVVVLLATVALFVPVLEARSWVATIAEQAEVDGSANSRAATQWVIENVGRDAVIVTDDYIWLDLVMAGYDNTVWLWKVDTDPAVMAEHLPNGFASIDYIVMAGQAVSTLASLPTLKAGVQSSEVVTAFGEVEIRRVIAPGSAPGSPPGPQSGSASGSATD